MDAIRTPEALTSVEKTMEARPKHKPRTSTHRREAMRPHPMPIDPDDLPASEKRSTLADLVFSIFVGLVAWLALIWAFRAAISILY